MNSSQKQLDLDLVILAVLEQHALYGLEIVKEVQSRTNQALQFKEGSLYPALHRLVRLGWVDSEWQPSTTGGAPRKYYRLSDEGSRALQNKKLEWANLKTALDTLMGVV
jgi:PadR family transcriptional regulator, regulatory protein PadR